MIHIEHSIFIRAPLESVFEMATDYEAFPALMPKRFSYVKIRSRRGDVAVVEERLVVAGRTLHVLARHEAHGRTHSISMLGGPARGSVFVEEYSETSNGTLMKIDARIHLRGILSFIQPFVVGRIRREITLGAQEFATVAENKLG